MLKVIKKSDGLNNLNHIIYNTTHTTKGFSILVISTFSFNLYFITIIYNLLRMQ